MLLMALLIPINHKESAAMPTRILTGIPMVSIFICGKLREMTLNANSTINNAKTTGEAIAKPKLNKPATCFKSGMNA